MPIHAWSGVDAGIFYHFHLEWIGDLSRVLNRGLLPPDYYALAEQIAGGLRPDVLTLHFGLGSGAVVLARRLDRSWIFVIRARVITVPRSTPS